MFVCLSRGPERSVGRGAISPPVAKRCGIEAGGYGAAIERGHGGRRARGFPRPGEQVLAVWLSGLLTSATALLVYMCTTPGNKRSSSAKNAGNKLFAVAHCGRLYCCGGSPERQKPTVVVGLRGKQSCGAALVSVQNERTSS